MAFSPQHSRNFAPPRGTRTTIYLSDTDRQAIAALQAYYGLSTLSDVLRFAVRTQAQQAQVQEEHATAHFAVMAPLLAKSSAPSGARENSADASGRQLSELSSLGKQLQAEIQDSHLRASQTVSLATEVFFRCWKQRTRR